MVPINNCVLNNYSDSLIVAFEIVMKVKTEKDFLLLLILLLHFLFLMFCVASTVTFFWRVRAPNPPMRGNLEGTQSID